MSAARTDPYWYQKELARYRGQLAAGRWDAPPARPTMGVDARRPVGLDTPFPTSHDTEGPVQQGDGGLLTAVGGLIGAVGSTFANEDQKARDLAAKARADAAKKKQADQLTMVAIAGAAVIVLLWLKHKGKL